MSLTKVTYAMISGAPANVLDFGADPTGAEDSTDAFIAAVAASNAVYIPIGTYKITDTIHIDRDGVNVFGDGNGSVINFAPTTAPGKLFLIQAADTSALIQYVNFRYFAVKAAYPSAIQKMAFTFVDASLCEVVNVNSVDYSWTNTGTATSMFFVFAGRDQHTIRNCHINADFPVYVTKNPNSTQFQFDVYTFENLSLQTLNPSNYAITFEPGVNISQWTMLGRNIALTGKGGIYYNDTETGTMTSSMILIDSFRVEAGPASGGDAGGYGIYMNFGSGNPACGNITIRNSSVNDAGTNGYHFENVTSLQVENINCGFSSTNNAFILQDVDNAEVIALGVNNDSATVLFSNMYQDLVVKPAYGGSLTNPSVAYGLYTHYDVDAPNRYRVYQNGVRTWQRKQVMANTNTMSLPNLASSETMLVNVTCDFGYGLYQVTSSTATLIAGTAGYGVAGGGNISVVANAGSPYLINNSAGSQLMIVTTSGA